MVTLGRQGDVRPRPSSRSETRVLVALLVAVSAIGPLVAALAETRVGPLAVLRYVFTSPVPDAATVRQVCGDPAGGCVAAQTRIRLDGAGSAVMSVMPVVLLLVSAVGLWRGRRVAWVAALVVERCARARGSGAGRDQGVGVDRPALGARLGCACARLAGAGAACVAAARGGGGAGRDPAAVPPAGAARGSGRGRADHGAGVRCGGRGVRGGRVCGAAGVHARAGSGRAAGGPAHPAAPAGLPGAAGARVPACVGARAVAVRLDGSAVLGGVLRGRAADLLRRPPCRGRP